MFPSLRSPLFQSLGSDESVDTLNALHVKHLMHVMHVQIGIKW